MRGKAGGGGGLWSTAIIGVGCLLIINSCRNQPSRCLIALFFLRLRLLVRPDLFIEPHPDHDAATAKALLMAPLGTLIECFLLFCCFFLVRPGQNTDCCSMCFFPSSMPLSFRYRAAVAVALRDPMIGAMLKNKPRKPLCCRFLFVFFQRRNLFFFSCIATGPVLLDQG